MKFLMVNDVQHRHSNALPLYLSMSVQSVKLAAMQLFRQ